MELKEYIKQSYLQPNKQVLESLGASDELIEYLRTTPWNTNLNIIDSLVSSENKTIELQLIGKLQGRYDESEDRDYFHYEGSVISEQPLPSSGQVTFHYIWDGVEENVRDDSFLELYAVSIGFFDVLLKDDRKTISIFQPDDYEGIYPEEIVIDIKITM